MSHFNYLPEFEKELAKLSRKYPSLLEDIQKLEKILIVNPAGFGTNFTTIHDSPNTKIIKSRLACKSLRNRSIRIIYAYHANTIEFMYIEVYFKGDKENEDRARITEYLENK